MGRYTLWCLNRVARWNQHKLMGALAARGHAVRAGSRARFDRAPLGQGVTRDGVLMHEELACDEYFVPIVVKCVGDPDRFLDRFGGALTADGRARFEALRSDFPQFYPRPGSPAHLRDWREYWKTFPINSAFWHVGMFTRTDGPHAYAGLYEVLAQEARDNGERAVLIGYSQGGLVARFLAWMDEQLMASDERAVAAVITVQSPNHGSPLADGANVGNAGTGLLGAVTGLLGYPIIPSEDPHTHAAVEALVAGQLRVPDPQAETHPPYHFGVGAVCALLDAMIRDTPRSRPEKADVLRTCRKWLTGLSPAKMFTAFADLDPRGLDDPRSVLGRLMAAPLDQVFHGAIIGGDPSAEDLIVQQRPWWQRWLIRLLAKPSWFDDLARPFAEIVMNEAASPEPPQSPLHAALAELYRTGLSGSAAEVTLPPFAHDFVIPAVSQALYTLGHRPTNVPFLGNRLNAKATHASGADPDDDACDLPFVEQMLGDLADRLP
ncbi:MAG: hypothetical protein ABUS79_19065 [Pseudomonadota bacterium]